MDHIIHNVIKDIIERHFPFWNISRRALDVYISEIEKSSASKEVKAWQILHAKQDFKKLANIKSVFGNCSRSNIAKE